MMDKILWQIGPITYARRQIGRGVILGARKYKSELVRTEKPCQVRNEHGHEISYRTFHRRDFKIFVPADELTPGQTLTWLNWEAGQTLERVLSVLEVSLHHAVVGVMSSEQRVFPKRRNRQRGVNAAADSGPFDPLTDNPFLPRSVLAARRYHSDPRRHCLEHSAIAPDTLSFRGRTYRRKTNFCYIYDPEGRKRRGSVWFRARQESIELEFFRHNFELYDLLTGRKLDTFLDDVRARHFAETAHVSPQWQLAG